MKPSQPPQEAPARGPVTLTYVGPRDAESPRYGPLVPGQAYQEADPEFAAYLVAHHPDCWMVAHDAATPARS